MLLGLLSDDDLYVRIAAGEDIALMFEMNENEVIYSRILTVSSNLMWNRMPRCSWMSMTCTA